MWNSGPMYTPPAQPEPDLVAEARALLRAFRVEDRATARLLVMLWKQRTALSGEQVQEILDRYPDVEYQWEPGS